MNLKLLEMMRYILDPVRSYFKINDQDMANSMLPTMIDSHAYSANDSHTNFIDSLEPGMAVDCVKTDHDYKKSVWAKGTVAKVKRGMVSVQFSDETEKCVDLKQRLELMPAGSHLKEEDY